MVRLLFILVLLCAPRAWALESHVFQTPRDSVTLISGADSYQPGQKLLIGLRFRTAPGWNIYWKNPGDAGTAPEVKLAVSGGGKAGEIFWPTPARQPEDGIMTYGYSGEAVLPVEVTPGADRTLTVTAHVSWLICQHICVPEKNDFSLSVPQGNGEASAQAPLIQAALLERPQTSPFAATIASDGRLIVAGSGLSERTVRDAWFFADKWGPIDISAPQKLSVGDGRVTLALAKGPAWVAGAPLSGVLVLQDPMGDRSNLAVTASPGAAAPAVSPWAMLVPAFLGGLILNLMPCVFPILAMKAMAVARMAGAERSHVRRESVFYTLGVVVSFVVLGVGLAGVRRLGLDWGWGFQFQNPVFVAVMAGVMLAVGLNLAGVFEVVLAVGVGSAGSFWTGLLAVLLATPCTAPFMAVAIAAALAAPVWVAGAIFLALGLGMAAPYALLAVVPGLARLLPRPGAWMEWLRRVLALPMLAAAGWLVWVESEQVSLVGLGFTLFGLAAVVFGLLAVRLYQRGGSGRGLAWNGGLAAVVAGVALWQIGGRGAGAVADQATRFTEARLASLRSQGRPVFVDMTAAWCVTCLVNERVALEPARVKAAFLDKRVAYLKGDWTRQNPEITQFLREFGREGVPLYVYYPAGNGKPVVLPQILSPSLVLNQIGGAKG